MTMVATKTFFAVTIADTGEVFRCRADETLLSGMERLGTVVDNLLTGRVLQRGSPIPELVAMLLLPLLTVWLLAR